MSLHRTASLLALATLLLGPSCDEPPPPPATPGPERTGPARGEVGEREATSPGEALPDPHDEPAPTLPLVEGEGAGLGGGSEPLAGGFGLGEPGASEGRPPTPGAGEPDPLLLKVCAAHDEVAAEGVREDLLLQTVALRAVERHGVSEAQLAELGARPAALLASIRERGSPPQCAAFVAALRARLP